MVQRLVGCCRGAVHRLWRRDAVARTHEGALSAPLAAAITAAIAHAEGTTVYQEDKKFSDPEVTIKAGQAVVFANKDPFTHNVYSKTPGMSFDLRTQKPGESSEVKFDHAGESEVQCAIHPQMKMKIKVTD